MPRKPRTSRRPLLRGLAAWPLHLATQSTPLWPGGRWVRGALAGNGARRSSPLGGRRPRASAQRAFWTACARRAPPAGARSRAFSSPWRPGQRAPPYARPQAALAGPCGARTGPAQAPHSGRPARGFARPAPQRRSWALARGAWPWPGSPPQSESPPLPPPPPPQSVSSQQWRKEVSERSCSRRRRSLRLSACARGPARRLTTLAVRPGRPAAGWGASAAAAWPPGPAPTCSPSPCWTAPPRRWRKSGRTRGWRSASSGSRSPCSAASSTGLSRGMSGRSACTPVSSTVAAPAPERLAAPRGLLRPRRGRRRPPGPPLRPAPPPGPPRRGRPPGWAQRPERRAAAARGCHSAGASVCWTAARWRTCCKSVGASPAPLWCLAFFSAGAFSLREPVAEIPAFCPTLVPLPKDTLVT